MLKNHKGEEILAMKSNQRVIYMKRNVKFVAPEKLNWLLKKIANMQIKPRLHNRLI